MPDSLVVLGVIAAAHGVRGEVKIRTFTERPENIITYGALTDKSGAREFSLTLTGKTAGGVIARIEGVNDRNAAEMLKGVELCVPRDRLPPPDEKKIYHTDLIGVTVKNTTGAPFGTVIAVHNFGAGDILEIKRTDLEQTELFTLTDATFPNIDLAARTAIIDPPGVME